MNLLSFVKKPILGKRRANALIAFYNALVGNFTIKRGTNLEEGLFISERNVILQLKDASPDAGAGAWRGAYSPDSIYNYGDEVYLTPEEAATYVGEDGIAVTVGGIYVWNNLAPSTPGVVPVHQLSSTFNIEQWLCTMTWPQAVNDCDSEGNPVVTFSDSQPEPVEES